MTWFLFVCFFAEDQSAFDYECTKQTAVRASLTIIHFLVLILVFFGFTILSLILYAVSSRRRINRMRSLPERRLPAFRDTLSSRKLHKSIVAGFVRASTDEICYSFSTKNSDDAAAAQRWGTGQRSRRNRIVNICVTVRFYEAGILKMTLAFLGSRRLYWSCLLHCFLFRYCT